MLTRLMEQLEQLDQTANRIARETAPGSPVACETDTLRRHIMEIRRILNAATKIGLAS